jgi:hypothetical protein
MSWWSRSNPNAPAVLARRLFELRLLDVGGDDHARDRPRADRHVHRPVDQMADLRRRHAGLDELRGDVLEQGREVDLLLVVRAQRERLLLPDDGHHRLVVELGVVQAVEKVDRTRPRGRHAHADPAAPLASAPAQKAAISSWRVWTNSTLSPWVWKAPRRPLMPSPG